MNDRYLILFTARVEGQIYKVDGEYVDGFEIELAAGEPYRIVDEDRNEYGYSMYVETTFESEREVLDPRTHDSVFVDVRHAVEVIVDPYDSEHGFSVVATDGRLVGGRVWTPPEPTVGRDWTEADAAP